MRVTAKHYEMILQWAVRSKLVPQDSADQSVPRFSIRHCCHVLVTSYSSELVLVQPRNDAETLAAAIIHQVCNSTCERLQQAVA